MAAGTVPGTVFVADASGAVEIHHRIPQILIRLWDEANAHATVDAASMQAWMDWEMEALLWGVDPEISRFELVALIEGSTTPMSRDEHRDLHKGDFQRWGRRGGLRTLERYGRPWFRLLAGRRWGKVSPAVLVQTRSITVGGNSG